MSSYTIGRDLILHVINVGFLLVLVCPLSHDIVLFCLTFELLVNLRALSSASRGVSVCERCEFTGLGAVRLRHLSSRLYHW